MLPAQQGARLALSLGKCHLVILLSRISNASCFQLPWFRVSISVQEQKVRRMAGLQPPPWTQEDEHHYCKHLVEVSIQGLCFATLKGS